MSDSSGYGSNDANGSDNSKSSFNGANAAAENHAEIGSNSSSSLNGGSLAGTSSSSATSLPSRATCASAGRSVARSNDAAQTNQALAMQVDAESDSGMESSQLMTSSRSSTGSQSGTVIASSSKASSVVGEQSGTSAPLSEANLSLYKSVLEDIKSRLLLRQIQTPSGAAARDLEELQTRADQLLRDSLANKRLSPSGRTLEQLRNTVDKYCRLIGWLQSDETLENATIDINYQPMDTKTVHRIPCPAAATVKDLQDALIAEFGGCTRQLLCNAQPLTEPTQLLYSRVAQRGGKGIRGGTSLIVNEVARTTSG